MLSTHAPVHTILAVHEPTPTPSSQEFKLEFAFLPFRGGHLAPLAVRFVEVCQLNSGSSLPSKRPCQGLLLYYTSCPARLLAISHMACHEIRMSPRRLEIYI